MRIKRGQKRTSRQKKRDAQYLRERAPRWEALRRYEALGWKLTHMWADEYKRSR